MNILLATDGSVSSQEAAREIARRPWPTGSTVKILTAIRLPFVPTAETRSLPESDYSRLERAARAQAEAAVSQAQTILEQAGAAGPAIESTIKLGDAREVILEEAAAWPADLIVLGSRGLSGFKRLLLGSVAQGVLTHAPCSVQIVRTPKASTSDE